MTSEPTSRITLHNGLRCSSRSESGRRRRHRAQPHTSWGAASAGATTGSHGTRRSLQRPRIRRSTSVFASHRANIARNARKSDPSRRFHHARAGSGPSCFAAPRFPSRPREGTATPASAEAPSRVGATNCFSYVAVANVEATAFPAVPIKIPRENISASRSPRRSKRRTARNPSVKLPATKQETKADGAELGQNLEVRVVDDVPGKDHVEPW